MNYKKLWELVFKEVVLQRKKNIKCWDDRSDMIYPFHLFTLNRAILPSAKTLGFASPCSRQLPVTREFDDHVLITVVFLTLRHRIYCAYTISFEDQPIFCLWERNSFGICQSLSLDAIPLQKVKSAHQKQTVIVHNESLEGSLFVEEEPTATIESFFSAAKLPHQSAPCTINCSDCVFESNDPFQEEYNNNHHSDEWDLLTTLFGELMDEYDGIATVISQDSGHGDYKPELLYLQSMWTSKWKLRCHYTRLSFQVTIYSVQFGCTYVAVPARLRMLIVWRLTCQESLSDFGVIESRLLILSVLLKATDIGVHFLDWLRRC
jgi:hypothetical protein